jgi:iron only hydrogenase large subunit-like protein/ribosomal protein L37E
MSTPIFALVAGECVRVCPHEARFFVDDYEDFIKALAQKEKMVAIVAPAVAAQFPEEYFHLNGWLKSIGVEAFFDVSFGAELTVESYLNHIKKNNPKTVIAQPCPAIVTYIQIYQPELTKYLAPAHSPMLHTIEMIKEFYPQYKNHKIAVISPCIAKKREFEETGLGDFNVTMGSIQNHLKRENINLKKYPETDFDHGPAERAVLFSTPGGLLQTAIREVPEAASFSRKIEGSGIIYEYLKGLPGMLEKGIAPKLIDCLNCEKGCNGGTGTPDREKNMDELEFLVENRKNRALEKHHAPDRTLEESLEILRTNIRKYWKETLYERKYRDLSGLNTIRTPDEKELQEIYRKMGKISIKDIKNCASCGYGECEKMATAIHNGLNKPENCHFYIQKELEKDKQNLAAGMEQMDRKIQNLSTEKIQEGFNLVREMVLSINQIVEAATRSSFLIEDLSKQNAKINSFIGKINEIIKKSNVLSINAGIEATRAGEAGKGFKIVAGEIRKLSESIHSFTREIQQLVLKSQGKTKETVASIEDKKKLVESGRMIMENLKKTFDAIILETENVLGIMEQIKEGSFCVEVF